ncbi:MAG TPA: polysaccharide biosynthesis/export family protein [Rhizomicrobium sp.]|jgi:protein involved in polysaccharide export with SLBB domain|nr:polysaccharide biosynthesis/export family protein [Rhizomicrobium sp.]
MKAKLFSALLAMVALALSLLFGALTPAAAQSVDSTDLTYKLGAGDKVKVNVYGQTDLSGEFVVDGSGTVQLPLIGQVKAMGLTVRQFETAITDALKSGDYLKDPRVSVEVSNYRPFYIIGEVNKPGEFPYQNDMTVLNAVALAGGFSFRADDGSVYIRRHGGTTEQKFPADQSTRVEPGDIIRVGERFF